MAFPGAIASFLGFTSSHTLSVDAHASQHNSEQAEIIATQTKIGTGSSTPTSGLVLRGTGAGSSAWQQVNLIADVTGVLPQANGGTGRTDATGTGAPVYSASPTISNPTVTGGGSWTGSPSLSTPTLSSPTISDFTNANHTHASTGQGGQLNGASAIQSATLKAAQMFNGIVKGRRGGTTGDNTWITGGSSNTDTSAKDVYIQVGAVGLAGSATDVGVVFPVAYSQPPLVFATVITDVAQNISVAVNSITTTGFNIRDTSASTGASETASWMAVGQ